MSIPGVLTFILVLSVLVFFHELGHFLFAKLFRMKVEEFAIGFGNPKIRVFHDGETEYNLRAFPLGGFVRIKGMEIEDAVEQRLTGSGEKTAHDHGNGFETTNVSTMSQEVSEVSGADADGFNNRPIYQRFWVILGGPLFSFLFGWLVFCLVGATFGIPDSRPTPVIAEVVANRPAARAGLLPGDRILSINQKPITTGTEMIDILHESAGKQLVLSVRAEKGAVRSVTVTPEAGPDPEGKRPSIGLIGIAPEQEVGEAKRLSLPESFDYGNRLTIFWFQTMAQVFSSPKRLGQSVGGPVAILKASNSASKEGGSSIVALIGQLSLSLGLFNLFPIPVLDGGHLTLMFLEGIRKRKLTAEQTNRVFTAGFAVIAVLAIVILFKDVIGLIHPALPK